MGKESAYIIEYIRLDHQVKVTACDPLTGKEVSIVGPASATAKSLSDLAIRKLLYVLGKESK